MTAPDIRERIDAAAARLRRHLAQPGAFARLSPLGCGRIALYRGGQRATLGAGFVPTEAADALSAQGHAVWTGEGDRRRLHAAPSSPEPRPAIVPAVIERDGRSETVMLDTRESPLLWLHRRPGRDGKPQISDEEFAAGERFRSDWTLARLMPRTTMNWDASLAPDGRGAGNRGPAAASDSALAARQRVRQTCDRLGPQLSGLVIDVCGFLKGLDAVERERGWPARSAKVVLRLALEALVAHYGLDTTRREATTRPSVWREEGARPAITSSRTG